MSEKLCVVMPVYNEQEAIGPVLEKWAKALDALGIDYAIRPYNDGSKDSSLAVMKDTAAHLPHVDVHDKKNGGHGNTILTGYREAAADGFDWVFQIDSDDEMGPEKFAELWAKHGDYDFLVGIRDGRVQQLPRKVISFVSRLCVRLFYGKSVWDVNTPYRLMRVSAFKEFYHEIPLTTFAPNVILSGLAARHNLRSYEIRVPQHDRTTGEVSIKRWKLFKAAVRSFLQTIIFSFKRPNFLSYVTMSLAVAGICLSLLPLFYRLNCITAVLLCLFVLGLRRYCPLASLITWVKCNPQLAFGAVVVGGMLLRIFVGTVLGFWSDEPPVDGMCSDEFVFWCWGKSLAAGIWPDNKSWTTVCFYGGIIRVFGEHVNCLIVGNIVLQIFTTWVAFLFVRGLYGASVGIFASALVFFNLEMVITGFKLLSENMFFLWLFLSLYFCSRVIAEKSLLRFVFLSFLMCISIWGSIWTRGVGIVLWVALPFAVCFSLLVRRKWSRGFLCGVICLVGFLAGAIFATNVNKEYNGSFYCSNDGWWPRLAGSYLGRMGRTGGGRAEVMQRAKEMYPDKEFKFGLGYCPKELVPIIKDEIDNNWSRMTISQMAGLVYYKLVSDYSGYGYGFDNPNAFNRYTLITIFPIGIGLLSVLYLWRKSFDADESDMLVLTPVLILVGYTLVLAVGESLSRYGIVLPMLLSVYAAKEIASVDKCG